MLSSVKQFWYLSETMKSGGNYYLCKAQRAVARLRESEFNHGNAQGHQ